MHSNSASPAATHVKCGAQLSSESCPLCQHASRNGGTCISTKTWSQRATGFLTPAPPSSAIKAYHQRRAGLAADGAMTDTLVRRLRNLGAGNQ